MNVQKNKVPMDVKVYGVYFKVTRYTRRYINNDPDVNEWGCGACGMFNCIPPFNN
jgi:hypothetical protein